MKRQAFGILAIFIFLSTEMAVASDPEAHAILCENLSAFHGLWQDSAFGEDPNRTERAAWIVRSEKTRFEFLRWPRSDARSQEIWKGTIPKNIVAQVHTHPANVDPKPSRNDRLVAGQIRALLYVISKGGIWVAGPDGRSHREAGPGWYKKLSSECN